MNILTLATGMQQQFLFPLQVAKATWAVPVVKRSPQLPSTLTIKV